MLWVSDASKVRLMKTRFLLLMTFCLTILHSPFAVSDVCHKNVIQLNRAQTALAGLLRSVLNELKNFRGESLLGPDNFLEVAAISLAIQEEIIPQIVPDESSEHILTELAQMSRSLNQVSKMGMIRTPKTASSLLASAQNQLIEILNRFRKFVFKILPKNPDGEESVDKQFKIDEILRFFQPCMFELITKSQTGIELTREELKQLRKIKLKVDSLLEARKSCSSISKRWPQPLKK